MDELRGRRTILRPVTADDAETLRRIHLAPEVVAWWGQPDQGFPLSDEPDATRLTVWDGEKIAGLVQFGEEPEPDCRHAWIDVFLAPELRGGGLGTDVVKTVLHHLVDERGHHRVTIDPALDNAAAIRCYEKAGFSRVGIMRRAWRDPEGTWRDVLLMEFVTGGVTPRDQP